MNQIPLYPLRFKPIYQYRLWGGRRLGNLLSTPLPEECSIGEAWILSDRDDHPSLVEDGPLKGMTIAQLLDQSPKQLMGKLAGHFSRFPLLLKFLDVSKPLSVQVHPSGANIDLIPSGETGKTEAWVVLKAGTKSCIYAGLKPGTTAACCRPPCPRAPFSSSIETRPTNIRVRALHLQFRGVQSAHVLTRHICVRCAISNAQWRASSNTIWRQRTLANTPHGRSYASYR